MNEYIKAWKTEHLEIMKLLNSAAIYDICGKANQEKMLEAKKLILQHLKSEDEVLYPMVKKVAREKVSMYRVLEIYTKEMDELAPKILSFFKECEDNPIADELLSELRKIIELLRIRIHKEENIFIKQYEDIINKACNEKS